MYELNRSAGLLAVSRDGAHSSAIPDVPCAHVTTGQPPFGVLPLGIDTSPETATGFSSTPGGRERTARVLLAEFSFAPFVPPRAQIGVPCLPLGSGLGGVEKASPAGPVRTLAAAGTAAV